MSEQTPKQRRDKHHSKPKRANPQELREGDNKHQHKTKPKYKRALEQIGGAIKRSGDEAMANALAHALDVDNERAQQREEMFTHPFHTYPARLHPESAHRLVTLAKTLVPGKSLTLLDSFCGSGTVLIEGLVQHCDVVGTDLSPLAVDLARVKTSVLSASEFREWQFFSPRKLVKIAEWVAAETKRVNTPKGEEQWYSPRVQLEIDALRTVISSDYGTAWLRPFWQMILSSILVKVSYQCSETDPRKVEKKVFPNDVLRWFVRKGDELFDCLQSLAKTQTKIKTKVDVYLDDAKVLRSIKDGSMDVVITSPPYANTYDYVSHHTRRYRWLGYDTRQIEQNEIGAARWFANAQRGALRFQQELNDWLKSVARVLTKNGVVMVVLGDGSVGTVPLYADEMLNESAKGAGLRVMAQASQERKVFDRVAASAFTKRSKQEHFVLLGR